ncbi:MAG: hypothetical protein ACFCVG_09950 [Kineosporiaceae bacterium]
MQLSDQLTDNRCAVAWSRRFVQRRHDPGNDPRHQEREAVRRVGRPQRDALDQVGVDGRQQLI